MTKAKLKQTPRMSSDHHAKKGHAKKGNAKKKVAIGKFKNNSLSLKFFAECLNFS